MPLAPFILLSIDEFNLRANWHNTQNKSHRTGWYYGKLLDLTYIDEGAFKMTQYAIIYGWICH